MLQYAAVSESMCAPLLIGTLRPTMGMDTAGNHMMLFADRVASLSSLNINCKVWSLFWSKVLVFSLEMWAPDIF